MSCQVALLNTKDQSHFKGPGSFSMLDQSSDKDLIFLGQASMDIKSICKSKKEYSKNENT